MCPIEVFLLCKLAHIEGVVSYKETLYRKKYFCCVMELVRDSLTLKAILDREGPPTEITMWVIYRQVVDTMVNIFYAGVDHGSLNSTKVLVRVNDGKYETKIFGFSSGSWMSSTSTVIYDLGKLLCEIATAGKVELVQGSYSVEELKCLIPGRSDHFYRVAAYCLKTEVTNGEGVRRLLDMMRKW